MMNCITSSPLKKDYETDDCISLIEAKVVNRYDDDNYSDNIHNIPITLADQSIENLRLLSKTGDITRFEVENRLKLLKSYLEYQRECDIEDEVDKNSRNPFLLLHGLLSFFCSCYKNSSTNNNRDIDID